MIDIVYCALLCAMPSSRVDVLLQVSSQELSPYQERMKHLKEIQRKTLEERKRIEEQVCEGQGCVSGTHS